MLLVLHSQLSHAQMLSNAVSGLSVVARLSRMLSQRQETATLRAAIDEGRLDRPCTSSHKALMMQSTCSPPAMHPVSCDDGPRHRSSTQQAQLCNCSRHSGVIIERQMQPAFYIFYCSIDTIGAGWLVSLKQGKIWAMLLLFTHRKLHEHFSLVPKSTTLTLDGHYAVFIRTLLYNAYINSGFISICKPHFRTIVYRPIENT